VGLAPPAKRVARTGGGIDTIAAAIGGSAIGATGATIATRAKRGTTAAS